MHDIEKVTNLINALAKLNESFYMGDLSGRFVRAGSLKTVEKIDAITITLMDTLDHRIKNGTIS